MYALYADNYADTTWPLFERDLAAKTHVILLRDQYGHLCGFSTLQLYRSTAAGLSLRVCYSGDTIIEPSHWGSSALAFEWIRFAGVVQRQEPATALYWLLIVKGHRTYRYLSTFANRYTPDHRTAASPQQEQILNALATEKFGDDFDAATGIVRFASAHGRLRQDLAEVPGRHRRLAAVDYFLKRNPGYAAGDELVCLCELAADNLKPIAARIFQPASA